VVEPYHKEPVRTDGANYKPKTENGKRDAGNVMKNREKNNRRTYLARR